MTDFLDNLGNHQHQKMLREISNDDKTPKKRDSLEKSFLMKVSDQMFLDHFLKILTISLPKQ
jgi:hypothetical protein